MAESKNKKHVLGLSGGKDSAALAVYMREKYPKIDIEYFFTDTGKELPEVYDYLAKLEKFLGKPIVRLNAKQGFDFHLGQFNGFLPSYRERWCTRLLKIVPFQKWARGFISEGKVVYSYVAIRADETYRTGFCSTNKDLIVKLPFQDDGVDRGGVLDILDKSGLGLPKYYEWRTRSGCTFCFFQRGIEWVGLLERHPDKFKEAMEYEKLGGGEGSKFTWRQGETLAELAKPERVAAIKAHDKKRREAIKRKQQQGDFFDEDDDGHPDPYGTDRICVACHK